MTIVDRRKRKSFCSDGGVQMPVRNPYPIKLVLGGLVGINIVFLQSLLFQGKFDIPSIISIISFALALPMLSFSFLIREQPRSTEKMNKRYPSVGRITQVGILADLVGIAALFWHALLPAGIVFLVSGIVAFSIYFRVDRDIREDTPQKAGSLQKAGLGRQSTEVLDRQQQEISQKNRNFL